MERVKFMKYFLWQSFHLESECKRVSDFGAKHQVNNTVEEQLRKYELTELDFPAIQLQHRTGLSLETLCCYWQTCHRSWMISYVNT